MGGGNGSESLDGKSRQHRTDGRSISPPHIAAGSVAVMSVVTDNSSFFSERMDIAQLNDRELERIVDWVNNYQRKIHGYRTANEMAV